MTEDKKTNEMFVDSKARIVAGGPKTVFVVFGRNYLAKEAMMNYLIDLGVDARELTTTPYSKGTPNVEELLDDAFREARGIVVLMTPDDESRLRDCWADSYDQSCRLDEFMYQPRMNVLFEIGLAWGRDHKKNTILVEVNKPIRGKVLRLPSDISSNDLNVRMYDARTVEKGLLDIRSRLEDVILKCKLKELDDGQMSEYRTRFIHAIEERIKPTDIEGLDGGHWVARTVSGVRQGVDYSRVYLGGPFRMLRVAISSDSPYWRGGIKLQESNPSETVPALVSEKTLLFHLGGWKGKYAVSGYYDSSWDDLKNKKKRPFVDTLLESVKKTPIHIELAVHKQGAKNLLFCKVIEENRSWQPKPQVVIPNKLDLLSNVYLVAWGDSEIVDGKAVLRDYEVEFSDLEYDLLTE
jgi:hypothetical protein